MLLRTVRRSAFTLVELLVVIAIIGILVGLLLPAVQAAREAARRMSCSNNVKQLALAAQLYHDSNKRFPYGHHYRGVLNGGASADGGLGYGWAYALLPYLEQGNLYNQFVQIQPVMEKTITQNGILAATPLAAFSCPSDTKPPAHNDGALQPSATSSYQGNGGAYDGWQGGVPTANPNALRYNGVFERNNRGAPYGMRDILDGTSNTVLICEARWDMDNGRRNRARIFGASDNIRYASGATNALLVNGEYAINWTQPEGNGQPHRTAGSFHTGGAQFGFSDGSVHFISENIDHTATPWLNNANAFVIPGSNGKPFGVYQRLYACQDNFTIEGLEL